MGKAVKILLNDFLKNKPVNCKTWRSLFSQDSALSFRLVEDRIQQSSAPQRGTAWSDGPDPGAEPKPWKLKAKAAPLFDFQPVKQQAGSNPQVWFMQPLSGGSTGKSWSSCSQHTQFCSSHRNHCRFQITPGYQLKDIFYCFVAKSRAGTAQQRPSGASGGKAAPCKGQQLLTHAVSSHPAQGWPCPCPPCLQPIPFGWHSLGCSLCTHTHSRDGQELTPPLNSQS